MIHRDEACDRARVLPVRAKAVSLSHLTQYDKQLTEATTAMRVCSRSGETIDIRVKALHRRKTEEGKVEK